MASSSAKPAFPLVKTALAITLLSVVILGAISFAGMQFQLASQNQIIAILSAGIASWFICLTSIILLSQLQAAKPFSMAYAQFAGSIGRLFLCVISAFILVSFDMPSKSVIIGLVAVYLPVNVFESIVVAKFVSQAMANESQQPTILTEQAS